MSSTGHVRSFFDVKVSTSEDRKVMMYAAVAPGFLTLLAPLAVVLTSLHSRLWGVGRDLNRDRRYQRAQHPSLAAGVTQPPLPAKNYCCKQIPRGRICI